MSSTSLPECLGGEFGGSGGCSCWFGVGASCRRPSRGSWGFEPPISCEAGETTIEGHFSDSILPGGDFSDGGGDFRLNI